MQAKIANYKSNMSEKELHSYRLSSLEEPTDEQLFALMEKVGETIQESTKRVALMHHQRLQEIADL